MAIESSPRNDPAVAVDTRSAAAGLAEGSIEPVGRFRYDVLSETWWWSAGVYQIHGLDVGAVVPTADLILSYQHPDDRAGAERTLRHVISDGQAFCGRHRIIDTAGRTRTVVVVGEGVHNPESGEVMQVRGYFIDVTEPLMAELRKVSHDAVQQSAQSRGVIEQAKGALMATYSIDEHEAFALLRFHSQNNNVKLRDLATYFVEKLTAPDLSRMLPRLKIGHVLATLPDERPTPIGGRADRRPSP